MNDDREPLQLLLARAPSTLKVIDGDGLLPAFRPQPWAPVLYEGDTREIYSSVRPKNAHALKKRDDEWV